MRIHAPAPPMHIERNPEAELLAITVFVSRAKVLMEHAAGTRVACAAHLPQHARESCMTQSGASRRISSMITGVSRLPSSASSSAIRTWFGSGLVGSSSGSRSAWVANLAPVPSIPALKSSEV